MTASDLAPASKELPIKGEETPAKQRFVGKEACPKAVASEPVVDNHAKLSNSTPTVSDDQVPASK